MQEPRPFFHRVESLRGIGAMMVAGWHVSGWTMNGIQILPHGPWSTAGAAQNAIGRFELALLPGHAALMMFFVISGLVLRVSLQFGPHEAWRAAARFHVARIFRIYPICIVAVLCAVVMSHTLTWVQNNDPALIPRSLSTIIANLLLVDVSMVPTLWAIQLEALMAPIIVLLFLLERRYGPWLLVAVAVITGGLSFSSKWALWQPLSSNMFAFVLGMLAPTLGRRIVHSLKRSTAVWLLIAAVVGLFLTGPVFGFYSRFAAYFEGHLAVLLICLVAYRADLPGCGLLDMRPVRMVGLASGAYYVLHPLLLIVLAPMIELLIPVGLSATAPAIVGAIAIACCMVGIIPVALLGYYLIEASGIELGRRVIHRIGLAR